MLEISGCRAAYGDNIIFDDLSCSFAPGDSVSIVGASGCGKSTLVLTASGLLSPSVGSVRLDGMPLQRGDSRVGLILQNYGLFPWMTVFENASLSLRIKGGFRGRTVSADSRVRVMDILRELGLEQKEKEYPSNLSGGEQQRVAIARAIVAKPEVLLMDEPFSALDAISRENLQDMVKNVIMQHKLMMIMVTHSVEEAVYMGSRLMIMKKTDKGAVLDELPNPSWDRPDVRLDDLYFLTVKELRKRLKNG